MFASPPYRQSSFLYNAGLTRLKRQTAYWNITLKVPTAFLRLDDTDVMNKCKTALRRNGLMPSCQILCDEISGVIQDGYAT